MRIECEGLNNVIARKERLLQGSCKSSSACPAQVSLTRFRGPGSSPNCGICAGRARVDAKSPRAVDQEVAAADDNAAEGGPVIAATLGTRMCQSAGRRQELEGRLGAGSQGSEGRNEARGRTESQRARRCGKCGFNSLAYPTSLTVAAHKTPGTRKNGSSAIVSSKLQPRRPP